MMIIILLLSVMGLIISIYGIIVEHRIKQDALYKPSCDISDIISCSRAFLSPYGKILAISNIWASAYYYATLIIVSLTSYVSMALLITASGVIISIIYAYILYFKIRSICPICTTLYIINILLLGTSLFYWSHLHLIGAIN